MMKCMQGAGFEATYPERRTTHAFVISLKKNAKQQQVSALEFAKRLSDYGFHPPPFDSLPVTDSWLIESTETASISVSSEKLTA